MDDTSRRMTRNDETAGAGSEKMSGRGEDQVTSYASTRSGGGEMDVEMDQDARRRTSEIRREIEETREDMSETIDAIQEKLRPGNVVASATERVKQATTERLKDMASSAGETAGDYMAQTREAGGGMMESARQNPIPAAMIGFGAAWLLMKRPKAPRYSGTLRSADYPPSNYQADYRARDSRSSGTYYDESESGVFDRVKENPIPAILAGVGLTWLGLAGRRGNGRWQSSSYRGERSGLSAGVGEDVSAGASRMAERAQEYAGDAQAALGRTRQRAQNQLERMVNENPLLVSAGALVLGAAVGLAIPETERENEWLGETRDTVVDRAQEMARKTATSVQEAAGDMAGDVVQRVVSGDEK